eukprot:gnl/Chilomastix_cuspidata/2771.p1 GENE.gnl/Chilomastix_cuspidata/2771~~gnl/Chilomastix_cuspidata/2771.p1  ORF type:complete len:779 (+),score=226.01 gnl/Chilomastix_cuspidata/2771:188-2524(+)
MLLGPQSDGPLTPLSSYISPPPHAVSAKPVDPPRTSEPAASNQPGSQTSSERQFPFEVPFGFGTAAPLEPPMAAPPHAAGSFEPSNGNFFSASEAPLTAAPLAARSAAPSGTLFSQPSGIFPLLVSTSVDSVRAFLETSLGSSDLDQEHRALLAALLCRLRRTIPSIGEETRADHELVETLTTFEAKRADASEFSTPADSPQGALDISQRVLSGQLFDACASAVAAGQHAVALVLARALPPPARRSIEAQVVAATPGPASLRLLLEANLDIVDETSELQTGAEGPQGGAWAESLALLLRAGASPLCVKRGAAILGSRLLRAGQVLEAHVCFVTAGVLPASNTRFAFVGLLDASADPTEPFAAARDWGAGRFLSPLRLTEILNFVRSREVAFVNAATHLPPRSRFVQDAAWFAPVYHADADAILSALSFSPHVVPFLLAATDQWEVELGLLQLRELVRIPADQQVDHAVAKPIAMPLPLPRTCVTALPLSVLPEHCAMPRTDDAKKALGLLGVACLKRRQHEGDAQLDTARLLRPCDAEVQQLAGIAGVSAGAAVQFFSFLLSAHVAHAPANPPRGAHPKPPITSKRSGAAPPMKPVQNRKLLEGIGKVATRGLETIFGPEPVETPTAAAQASRQSTRPPSASSDRPAHGRTHERSMSATSIPPAAPPQASPQFASRPGSPPRRAEPVTQPKTASPGKKRRGFWPFGKKDKNAPSASGEVTFYYNKELGRYVERGKEDEARAEKNAAPPPATVAAVAPSAASALDVVGGDSAAMYLNPF